MSKGQTKKTREAAGNRRKLTRAEKKQIAAVIRQAKGDGKAHTAQQTIPYLAMYPDGICKVAQRKYSKSIAFEDINYQLAQADDKTAIFENWCDFLNYFDASVNVQLSFINAELFKTEDKKRCTECGASFASTSNSVKYCPDCRKRITRRQAAERMRKRRALVTQ